jgi:AraC family transcriptional regulator of adaptative response / DNA-3-methyladenine glycosylase II
VPAAVARCRRLLDLDADPAAVDEQLGADEWLRPLVVARPGLRMPGVTDGAELAVRAVLGQQVSVAAARTTAGRLAERFGERVGQGSDGLTRRFPTASKLADVDPASLPLPRSRAVALVRLAQALAAGDLVVDPGADRQDVTARLVALPGIGPWTAAYVRLRALGDPDVFLPTDLGASRALRRLGAPDDARPNRWRPWRSYALHHLWSSLADGLVDKELAS